MEEASGDPIGWVIRERATRRDRVGRLHLHVVFASEQQAIATLADLLAPYPPGHMWRRKLVVRPAPPTSHRQGAPRG